MTKIPRGVDAIVDQQVRRWTMEEQARKRAVQEAKKPRPVIAVSREFGALGAALARSVAQALQYSFWDREILAEIANNSDIKEQVVNSLDEHRRDAIVEMVSVFGAGRTATAEDYHAGLARVVHTIAAHGNAVIVGRGAQYLLDPDATLRVRAVCELDKRIKGVMQRSDLGEDQARKLIATTDRDRRQFIREHFDQDCDDPTAYDLVLNTGRLPLHVATDIVVAASRARYGGVR